MVSRFKPSRKGIGELLRADFIVADMIARAERVKAVAEAYAPVDAGSDHPGRYKASFSVSGGVRGASYSRENALPRGVAGPQGPRVQGRTRRAYGRVTNSAPEAIWVEYGRGEYTTTRTTRDGKTYTVTIARMAAQRVMARALYTAAGL